jgi:hypothetical protein
VEQVDFKPVHPTICETPAFRESVAILDDHAPPLRGAPGFSPAHFSCFRA